jgi:hypothetical protein
MQPGKSLSSAFALVLFLPLTPAFSSDAPRGPHALAMGATDTADPASNDAIRVNPGLMGLLPRYDLAAYGAWGDRGYDVAGSVVDSQAFVTAGVGYRRLVHEPEFTDADLPGWLADGQLPANVKRFHEIAVGVAIPFFERRLSFGVGGVYAFTDHDLDDRATGGNANIGIAASPVHGLTVGLDGHNLNPLGSSDDAAPGVSLGARHRGALGAVAVELARDFGPTNSSWTARAGIDRAFETVHTRLGWWASTGELGRHNLTAGVGFENEEGAFDVAVAVPLIEGLGPRDLLLQAGFRARTSGGL